MRPVADEVYHPTTPQMYQRMKQLLRLIFSVFTRTTVIGLENVPLCGPLLVTVNHLSLLDPPALLITNPRQGVMFITSKHKNNPVIAPLVRAIGCIWVERGEADRAALRATLDVLKTDIAVGIAPEGTRSPTHSLQQAKTGVAYLATRSNATILPSAVWGVETLRQSLLRLRRARIFVRYGPAFRLPEDPRAKSDRLEAYTEEIMCRTAALLPEKYRGVYADHPRVKELVGLQSSPSPVASGAG
jgi:1-acyl-sn-glycerol-3-phosphate acyltransferase